MTPSLQWFAQYALKSVSFALKSGCLALKRVLLELVNRRALEAGRLFEGHGQEAELLELRLQELLELGL